MRLVKLKIRNIASLKGEHLIEFDEVEKASSLFAITGETGSGKSSILNAIAMALYGRIYKNNVNQIDLITLGEPEGQIQLIFALKGHFYLADWKGRIRKPNGEALKQPKFERVIQKISTPDFHTERSTEAFDAEELLNLNFDQFCKCIILNQGEFAKFLGSTFTDRKAILEKLYPGSDIENISRVLKTELDHANAKISIINTQLETLQLAPDEGEILKHKQQNISKELASKRKWQKRYSKLSKLFESLEIYYKAYHDNQNRLQKLAGEIKDITHLYNLSLVESEKALKVHEDYQALRDKRAPLLHELIKKEEQIKILREQIQGFAHQLKKINDEKSLTLKDFDLTQTSQLEWSHQYQNTIQSFFFSPELLLAHKIELESYVDLFTKIEKIEIEKKNIQEKFIEAESKGKILKTQITELENLMPKDPEGLKNKVLEFKKQKIQIQERLNQKEVQKKSKDSSLTRLEKLNKEITSLDLEMKKTQEEMNEKKVLKQSLELNLSLYDYQLSLKKCIDHASLNLHDHCPICDNKLEADFWKKLKFNVSETNIEELAGQHQKLQTSLQELMNKEILLQTQKVNSQEEIKKISDEINQLDKELQLEIPNLTLIEADIEKVEKELISLEHQKKELNRLNSEISLVRTQYVQAKDALTRIEASLEPLASEQHRLSDKLNDLNLQLAGNIEHIKKDLRSLVQLTQERKQGEALDQKLTHLKELIKKFDIDTKDLLDKTKTCETSLKTLEVHLQEQLHGKSAQEELNTLEQQIKDANTELQKSLLLQKNHEQSLSLKRGNVSSIEQLLKDYELKFIETLSLIKASEDISEGPLNEDVASFEGKLKLISLTVNDSVEVILAAKEFIQNTLTALEVEINELNNELGVTNEKLTQWEKTLDKIKLLKLEFDEAQSKVERYKRLSTILGTDELRTFALALVEENLIIQTNEELANLCDSRYEIIHQSRRGITPEFYILDKFREGGIRKVSTLSGGETFMVSLAMALALAEMTRGQAEIDTLFIDEGFGTLDQESLEDVLEMLNQIQNRGLMIGIISHIKTLTNALPVNIVLNKAQDGTSKVSLRYN